MVRTKNKSIIDDAIRNILLYDYVDMEKKERKHVEMANYEKAEDEDFDFYESSYYRPTMQIELLLFWQAMDLTTESYYFKDFKTFSLYHPTLSNAAEIKKLSVSEQYPTISLNSFEFYDSLEEITLCEGVKTIGKCKYRDLDTLFDLMMPNAYYEYSKDLELKEDSFQIAGNLEEYPILNLYGKERKKFKNSRIEIINLPKSLEKIGVYGLAGSGIKSLEIPENVTKIRRMAFIGCQNLESVTIPEGITVLDELLFGECKSLKDVTLPKSLIRIGKLAFNCCMSLRKISLPNSLMKIEELGFNCCKSLILIRLSYNLRFIDKLAFNFCTSLRKISLPNSLMKIEKLAFRCCTSLKNITARDCIISIEEGAFDGCSSIDPKYLTKFIEDQRLKVEKRWQKSFKSDMAYFNEAASRSL